MVHNICLLPEEENDPYSCPPLTSLSVLWQRKYQFCRDKSFVATNMLVARKVSLSGQNFCHNKIMFVITNIFVAMKLLSGQTHVCRNKHSFVTTRRVLSSEAHVCCDKRKLAVTKL